MDKMSLQLKFGCNWPIGSRKNPIFAQEIGAIYFLLISLCAEYKQILTCYVKLVMQACFLVGGQETQGEKNSRKQNSSTKTQ